MPPQKRQRNLNFREQEIAYILSRMKVGDSVSVVGVGSVGKSNLLRHFLRDDVQRLHLDEEGDWIHMVLIDPNNMLSSLPLTPNSKTLSGWSGYEIMTHRLHKAFYPLTGLDQEEKKAFLYAYEQLHNGNNPLLPFIGLRYLELALEQLLQQDSSVGRNLKVVFVFDEFESMLLHLPTKFFQTLRGLRDDYKYQLMYITLTRRSIPQIIEEKDYSWNELEPFVELFTDSTLFLGPYSESDAIAMLDRLSARQGVNYPPSFRRFLLRVTGGYAGILRASFRLAGQIPFGTPEDKAFQFLAENVAIITECQTIWESLTEAERVALRQIVANQSEDVSVTAVSLLLEKQLLPRQGVEINPPLFQEFVRREANKN